MGILNRVCSTLKTQVEKGGERWVNGSMLHCSTCTPPLRGGQGGDVEQPRTVQKPRWSKGGGEAVILLPILTSQVSAHAAQRPSCGPTQDPEPTMQPHAKGAE